MEGKLSERAKAIFKDPEKARLLMEYILNPASRRYIRISEINGVITIERIEGPKPVTKEEHPFEVH